MINHFNHMFSLPSSKLMRAVILLISCSLFLTRVEAQESKNLEKVSVQVSWNHQFQFAGLYAAKQQGYYEALGLDVSIKDWKQGINPIDSVAQGEADFGVSYGGTVNEILKGKPLKLVMSFFQYSPLVLISHTPFSSLKDFKDKSVMFYDNLQIKGMLNKMPDSIKSSVTYIKPTGNLQDFIDKKVDLYGAYLTNEPFRLKQLGIPYYVVDPKQYGIQSYGDVLFTNSTLAFSNPQLVKNFKEATIKGWEYALNNPDETVDYIINHYDVKKTREALLAEAQVTGRYVESGNIPIGTLSEEKLIATIGDAYALGIISEHEKKHFKFSDVVFSNQSMFTPQEQEYLASKPIIKLANDNNWLPFEMVDVDQGYIGVASDVLDLISQRTGIQFIPQNDLNWHDVVKGVNSGKFDMYSCAVKTPEREEKVKFTKPYLSFPNVLVSKKNESFITDYEDLNFKKVAVVKGFWSEELLKNNYPNIFIVPVNSVKEGMELVLSSSVFAYSGNLASINHNIRKFGFDGLHVIGQHQEPYELAMGVQKGNPILFSIIEKTLDEVKQSHEFTHVYDKWLRVPQNTEASFLEVLHTYKWYFMIFTILNMFVIFWFWLKRKEQEYLRQIQVKEKQAALARAKSIETEFSLNKAYQERLESFFSMVIHEVKTPISMIDSSIQTLAIIKDDKEQVEKRYSVIETASKRINYLVDRFLKKQMFEKTDLEAEIKPVIVKDFLKALCQNYPYELIELDVSSVGSIYRFDPELMHFALTNLIDNAIKYGGTAQKIRIKLCANNKSLIILVSNDGSNIDLRSINELFSPFVRGDNQGDISGTGLGLYFVENIVKLHSGNFFCSNIEHDRGAVFRLSLPLGETA